jgi:spermidine/putrescine-binding protein
MFFIGAHPCPIGGKNSFEICLQFPRALGMTSARRNWILVKFDSSRSFKEPRDGYPGAFGVKLDHHPQWHFQKHSGPFMKLPSIFLCLLSLIVFTSCKKADTSATTQSASTTDRQLNIYIWSEYLPKEVTDEFTRRTGIAVSVDTYDSNETLLAKLAAGVSGYDLVVPSDYVIQPLIRQGLLKELDHTQLPNLANDDPHFLNQRFDPENKYSIPYLWGTTGLAYNKHQITQPVDSWKILFDSRYSGKILMLNDMRECFVVALKTLGKSANETDPQILQRAADLLKTQHPLVRTYDSENYDNTLAAGDVWLAHGWNGQLAKVVAAHPADFAYILPKEGGTLWLDNLAIPSAAPHPAAALEFMNYIMDPQVNAKIVNAVSYASPNLPAHPYVDPKILNDPNIYPNVSKLTNWEFLDDLGKTTRTMSQMWTEIKAQ